MNNKNTRYVTIVTDGKGKFSYHTSWKSACSAYDWNYKKSVPSSMNGFKIIKAPLDVTIDCLDIVEFLNRNNVKQTARRESSEDRYVVEVDGYSKSYTIHTSFITKHEKTSVGGSDEYGREEILRGYDYDEHKDVLEVILYNDKTEEEKKIKIDSWTADQIIQTLDTEDYE